MAAVPFPCNGLIFDAKSSSIKFYYWGCRVRINLQSKSKLYQLCIEKSKKRRRKKEISNN